MPENRKKPKAPAQRAKAAKKAPAKAAAAPSTGAAPARNGGRFQKGRSGNPGGRPKLVGHVRELAQQQTEKAIKTLVKTLDAKDAPYAAKVAAAQAILDRGWGKPAQPIGGTDELPPVRTAREMTDAEILAAIQEAQDAAGAVEDGSRHG